MRKVLVHYHLFKNAGSSIDSCLSNSYGDAWHSFDPDANTGVYTASQLQKIIENHPKITAFSSHCLVPPLLSGAIKVCPIIVLREPISRILSAYAFEWQKQNGLVEQFDRSVAWLQQAYERDFPELRLRAISTNVTQTKNAPLCERHSSIAEKIGSELYAELIVRNQMDIQLYAYALGRFNAVATPQPDSPQQNNDSGQSARLIA